MPPPAGAFWALPLLAIAELLRTVLSVIVRVPLFLIPPPWGKVLAPPTSLAVLDAIVTSVSERSLSLRSPQPKAQFPSAIVSPETEELPVMPLNSKTGPAPFTTRFAEPGPEIVTGVETIGRVLPKLMVPDTAVASTVSGPAVPEAQAPTPVAVLADEMASRIVQETAEMSADV